MGCAYGDGLFQPFVIAGQSHALRHVSPALYQNVGFACTAVLQTPTKLCQTVPQIGFALISLGNTRNLVVWPSPPWIDIALAGGGGPESLVTGTYIEKRVEKPVLKKKTFSILLRRPRAQARAQPRAQARAPAKKDGKSKLAAEKILKNEGFSPPWPLL